MTTRSLRLLFINRMASMVRGGGETFDLEIARHLAQMGHRITFLTGIPLSGRARLPIGSKKSEVRSQKSDLGSPPSALCPLSPVHLRAPMLLWFPWDRVKGGWRVRIAEFKWFEWLAARWAWRHRDEFDIIQVCELPYFVSRFKTAARTDDRRPTTDDRRPTTDDRRWTSAPRVVMRLTAPDFHDPVHGLKKADAVIASGDTMRKVRAEKRPDCVDIPNGVDVEQFRVPSAECRMERRKRLGIAGDSMAVVHVARFQSVKNHAMLLEAFARVIRKEPHARLLLAGTGPLRSAVEKQVRDLGLGEAVCFLGEVPHGDLPAIYAAADINVMPSDYESFCFAVLEGMACGLPHVVTDTNWVPGLIGKQRSEVGSRKPEVGDATIVPGGVVVPIGDADAFARALLRLARDPTLRSEMGAWNRAKVEREHGWTTSAKRLVDLYARLVS